MQRVSPADLLLTTKTELAILEGLNALQKVLVEYSTKQGAALKLIELKKWVEDASFETGYLPHKTVPFVRFRDECGDNYKEFLFLVLTHYESHQDDILLSIESQKEKLTLSEDKKATFSEAIQVHKQGIFRLTCRALLPDVERVIYEDWLDKSGIGSVKARELENTIGEMPLRIFIQDHWSDWVLLNVLKSHLYSNGSNIKDFPQVPLPNRHAALHGWLNYPSQKHSFNMIVFADFIFRQGTFFNKIGREKQSNTTHGSISTSDIPPNRPTSKIPSPSVTAPPQIPRTMTDQELQNALQSMGMACFIKYYRQFCDLSLSTDDIVQLMIQNREPWTTKLHRAYMGRHIIQNGRREDALIRVVGSKVNPQTRQRAEQYLNELKP